MNFNKSKALRLSCFSFVVGVGLASFLPAWLQVLKIYLFAFLVVSIGSLFILWERKRYRYTIFFVLFFVFGIWRYSIAIHSTTISLVDNYNDQGLSVVGIVVDEPNKTSKYQKFIFYAESAVVEKTTRNIKGKILVYAPVYPRIDYGDRLDIRCELREPENFSDFNYDQYLAQYDIHSICYYPEAEILGKGEGNFLVARLFMLKNGAKRIINKGLSEPASSIVRAMLLGDKSGVSAEDKQLFSETGISHVIAISGMHISILIFILNQVLLSIGIKRRYVFYVTIIFLALYVVLIGMTASAVRASLMGFVVLLALQVGRVSKVENALYLVASILLFVNPLSLRSDVGFQLSFMAVLAIIYFYPVVDSWLKDKKIPRSMGLRDIFVITIVVQIMTTPIIVLNFGIFSLVSPLSNLLIVPLLPVLLAGSIMAIILSAVFPYFSLLLFLPIGLALDYIFLVSRALDNLSYSSVYIDHISSFWLIFYYVVIFFVFNIIKGKNFLISP